MVMSHFKDLGDTESVVMNAVALVLGECQISIATYTREYLPLPSYKVLKLYCNALGIYNYLPLLSQCGRIDRHTHTNSFNTIQLLCGSTNK